jgi:hypothetical protein
MRMEVCYACGVEAELVQSSTGGEGQMTITLFEPPKKIFNLFFECSICHGQFVGEQGYAKHWHERHC